MTETWLLLLCEISLIACALVAGVFLTFSDFVMRALNGARTSAGVEVMQGINREVFKTVFMVLLIGMWAVSAALGAYTYVALPGGVGAAIIAAAVIYSVGVAGVTLVFKDRKSTRLNSSHDQISYAVFCLKKKTTHYITEAAINKILQAFCCIL